MTECTLRKALKGMEECLEKNLEVKELVNLLKGLGESDFMIFIDALSKMGDELLEEFCDTMRVSMLEAEELVKKLAKTGSRISKNGVDAIYEAFFHYSIE